MRAAIENRRYCTWYRTSFVTVQPYLENMKLCHLPLRPSTLSLLQRRGFFSTSDIETSKRSGGITNLAAEMGCSLSEAAALVREVESAMTSTSRQCVDGRRTSQKITAPTSATTAASLLAQSKKSSSPRSIITFCRSIDTLLGGGMNLSEVTEVVGLPGVGKTQMAMQLCIDTRLSKEFGGVQGEAVYVDSEGSFSPERCLSMAQALVEHVRRNAERRQRNTVNQQQNAQQSITTILPDWFKPENILDGIHVYRVHDEAAQTAVIQSLPAFLDERASRGTPVRLIVIDSIAFHYRCAPPGSDYMARTRSLTTMAAFLSDLATKYDVAVVAINQMTTKVGAAAVPGSAAGGSALSSMDRGGSRLVPALGESWAHATTTRLLLSHNGGESASGAGDTTRSCTLVKSPHKAAGTAFYQVTESGIRDIRTTVNNLALDASKRQRRHY